MIKGMNAFCNKPNFGLLLARLSLGALMIIMGVPHFLGGMSSLKKMGLAMGVIGIKFFPVFWGFLAALTQTLGGFLVMIGFLFRPTCLLFVFFMFIATMTHLKAGHDFIQFTSRPIELGCVFLALMFTGAGEFSVDKS